MIPYWPLVVNRSGSGTTQSNELQQNPLGGPGGRYNMEVTKGDYIMAQSIVSTDLATSRVSQFYYSRELGDLVIGQANGVVSNGCRTQLQAGTFVMNYARCSVSGQYYVQVGMATGLINDLSANQIWPTWDGTNPVFQVNWITGLVVVPNSYFANQRQSLPNIDVMEIINYVLLAS